LDSNLNWSTKQPYVVLCNYYPAKPFRAWKVGRDLTKITAELGLIPFPRIGGKTNDGAAWNKPDLHAEVRLTSHGDAEGASWHQDGDNTPGADMNSALVLWADRLPTEFQSINNGQIYQPRPFELVIVRNRGCLHRRPPKAEGFRMSFRQRVVIPSAVDQLHLGVLA